MLVQSLSHDPEYLEMVRASGIVSLMVIPLPVRGQGRGAITLAFAESPRLFGPRDMRFAQELGRGAPAPRSRTRSRTAACKAASKRLTACTGSRRPSPAR
jgi:hypothetical protein